jgi:hypothetical protein
VVLLGAPAQCGWTRSGRPRNWWRFRVRLRIMSTGKFLLVDPVCSLICSKKGVFRGVGLAFLREDLDSDFPKLDKSQLYHTHLLTHPNTHSEN